MTINAWCREVKKALLLSKRKFSEKEEKSLLTDAIEEASDEGRKLTEEAGITPSSIKSGLEKFYDETYETLIAYFFKKASRGEPFGRIERVKERFGKTLEENYLISSGPFLDLAKTYWTFKIEVQDLFPENYKKLISQVLLKVEFDVAKYFFPTPGPASMPVEIRVEAQKELLKEYMPEVDIDLFLKNNPILFREFQDSLDSAGRLQRIDKIFKEAEKEFTKTNWFGNLIKKYKKRT